MNDLTTPSTQKKARLMAKRTPKSFKERDDRLYSLLDRSESELSISVDILIALFPILIWSVYLYGFRPIVITLLSAVLCLGLDVATKTVLRKRSGFDIYPLITGIIIAYGMPASAPLWLPVFGAVVATVISHLFRLLGRGRSILDPAALTLLICFVAFGGIMNAVPKAYQPLDPFAFSLSDFKVESISDLDKVLGGFLPDAEPAMLFFGLRSGMIGEASSFLLLLGLIYLVYRRIAKPLTPVIYLVTVCVLTYLEPSLTAASDTLALKGALYNVFGASTMLCAVYMLSLPNASPKTGRGRVIAGVIAGVVTVGMRYYLRADISALCGVISVGILTPLIDSAFRPSVFGGNLKESSVADDLKTKEKEQSEQNEQEIPS